MRVRNLDKYQIKIVSKNGLKVISQIDSDKNFDGVIERAKK